MGDKDNNGDNFENKKYWHLSISRSSIFQAK